MAVPVSCLVRGSPLPVPVRVRQGVEQGRKVVGDGRPEHIKVDVEAVVHEPVAHVGRCGPGNVGQIGAGLIADLFRGLSDDLDQLGGCEAKQLIVVKVAP